MSDMSERILIDTLAAGRCPDCDGKEFRPGPRGGMSYNIECIGCRARFNIGFTDTGCVVFAERIPSEADGGGAWPSIRYAKGDRVKITAGGSTCIGTVFIASSNGISIAVMPDGAEAAIPLMFVGADYASLITGAAVRVEPVRQ